ncbi:hypothetical protein [Caballeronia arationis]|uniref:hypothetical protein n=1 Tax=Caballeronia arationis TaxID=1777142 RepID=UPI00119825A1|nr:hypothetical protein [Caballeronia arationis]
MKMLGAKMVMRESARLFWKRVEFSKAKVLKPMEAAFRGSATEDEGGANKGINESGEVEERIADAQGEER